MQSFITQDSRDRDFMVKNMNSFGVPILNYVKDESYVRSPFEISKEVCGTRLQFSGGFEFTCT